MGRVNENRNNTLSQFSVYTKKVQKAILRDRLNMLSVLSATGNGSYTDFKYEISDLIKESRKELAELEEEIGL